MDSFTSFIDLLNRLNMKMTEDNSTWILFRPIVITVALIIMIGVLLSTF